LRGELNLILWDTNTDADSLNYGLLLRKLDGPTRTNTK